MIPRVTHTHTRLPIREAKKTKVTTPLLKAASTKTGNKSEGIPVTPRVTHTRLPIREAKKTEVTTNVHVACVHAKETNE